MMEGLPFFLVVAMMVMVMTQTIFAVYGNVECACSRIGTCTPEPMYNIPCTLEDGDEGVCCHVSHDMSMYKELMNNANIAGEQALADRIALEQKLINEERFLERDTAAFRHMSQLEFGDDTRLLNNYAFILMKATSELVDTLGMPASNGVEYLQEMDVRDTSLGYHCPWAINCSEPMSKYRTADGSCNNLCFPEYGMSNTPLKRMLPASYDDGVSEPRTKGRNGEPLPSVRYISVGLMPDLNKPAEAWTLSLAEWGQFISHDLSLVPFPSFENGEGIDCCSLQSREMHPNCFAIEIEADDPFFSHFNKTCMNFVRSMIALSPGDGCTISVAEQVNLLTHWMDGSHVYGSNQEQQNELRAFENGLLKTSAGDLLPFIPDKSEGCGGFGCFLAGDTRVNVQPGLSASHTIWLREHNRIAKKLQKLNHKWSDEEVFQEARRIVIAEMQHITYNEWLPIIVGKENMEKYKLGVESEGRNCSNQYNPRENPDMFNEFATAAFRFGHSMIQGTLNLMDSDGQVREVKLRDHFLDTSLIVGGHLDSVIRSLVEQPPQKSDTFASEDVTNFLFLPKNSTFGMDLMSLNLQRGRDHGLPTYNDMRVKLHMPRAKDFDDLLPEIESRNVINKLKKLYNHVDDIDLFAGGLSEKPAGGALLGPTFAYIVAHQFYNVMQADRFFYNLCNVFEEDQLLQIRKVSLARIICDNSGITTIQPFAFKKKDNLRNKEVSCTSNNIPKMNLKPWKV